MNSFNGINHIQYNTVNNIDELNLLHGILNSSKITKNVDSHYSPILDGWINMHRGKARFNNF